MNLNRRAFLGTTTAGLAGFFDAPFAGVSAAEPGKLPVELLDPAAARGVTALASLQAAWSKPARTHKPHTRWWWPGNALSKADITRQLEGMAGQGIGGVEIMSLWKMYEKGNVEYLTPEFLGLVKHAVTEAKRLDMEVAITFSPGWGFGGAWVPRQDQSKVLCMASKDVEGGTKFSGTLPQPDLKGVRSGEAPAPHPPGTVVAVVAGRIVSNSQIDPGSLIDLTKLARPAESALDWDMPAGQWRLMVFWLEFTGQVCSAQSFQPPPMVIDHMNQGAVQRYCEHLGGEFKKAIGDEFGHTVDSFFCDSFEFWPLSNALLWSTDTLAGFEHHTGYGLAKYLPALWFDVGPLTARIRYDLGDYLNHRGLEAFFKPFNAWCDAHHVQARIQPHYRFSEELVQGAGATARPETEVTTARFEPVADPRKATASGARFYGREIVSAEAYTFIHPARYRTNLQDLKIATDAFLRDGITQFYNHGYFGSPEAHVAPTRDFPWANRIDHWNTWWQHYHYVAEYVARCCAVLRQGRLVADVLIYSPQATAWSERAVWGSARRVMPYGNLAKTLVANGYDFDIVNDDLLQHHAEFRDGRIGINGHVYRLLILPRATVVPIATLRAMREFAKAGGTIVALDELPVTAAGLQEHEANDRELKQITEELFSSEASRLTGGVFLPEYKIERKPFNPGRQAAAPTAPLNPAQRRLLDVLGNLTPPDFALAGRTQSDGLTFIHKRVGDVEVYFVSNLQANRCATDVTFRVTGKAPQRWDARTGRMEDVREFRMVSDGTLLALDMEPWESAFFMFVPGARVAEPIKPQAANQPLSEPLVVAGTWKMRLEGYGFETYEASCETLASWTDAPRTRHFAGTGRYEIEIDVPAGNVADGVRAVLDLGQVGNLAGVEVNGRAVGVAWMVPYRLDITGALRAGKNTLVVRVTDALINYVSGLKQPPEVPAELQERLGKANPAVYPEGGSGYHEMGETDLPPSGLLGPVKIGFERAG